MISKRKKPTFLKQDAHRVKRLANNWRKPRGRQSKIRLGFRGYRTLVRVGYGNAKDVRGKTKANLIPTRVHKVADLTNLDPKAHGVIVAAGVSKRNRVAIIEAATKANLTILNLQKPADYAGKMESELKARKAARATRKTKRLEATTDKKAKDKKDKKAAKPSADEADQKDQAKKEKDKVLTKKGSA